MKKYNLHLLMAFIVIFLGFGTNKSVAQDKLLSGELPNGTTNITGEIVDPVSGYKLAYYNLKYLEDRNEKSYYQFNSGMGSFVKVEAPAGEYFQPGDEIRVDVYVNRGSNDSRVVSIYDRIDYNNGGVVVGSATAAGSVATVYNIVLGDNLPENTNVLYMPATSSINSYINIHGVDVYGERGSKAKLASLTVGSANLDGYKVSYLVDAMAPENTVTLNYTKEVGKDVTLAISDVQTSSVSNPSELANWNSSIPSSIAIPSVPGEGYYYYIRSSLAGHETVYYEIEIIRRNTADIIYNYDLTVNPITSIEDPGLSNIINTSGFHSSHGWRFNYASGSTLQVRVTGDAIIKLRGCGYNNEDSKITATVDNGVIVPAYELTAVKDCAGFNNFYYTGEANTITFTYSGVAFLSYITVINEGSAEAELRAVFVGEKELGLSDFDNGEYTITNIGYVSDPTATGAFPSVSFGMKKGLTAPTASGLLDASNKIYTHTFEYDGTIYKIHIPYEAETGYTENSIEQRYEISTAFGLKTVINMMNDGTAVYKTIYLPNGTYDLGDIDGSYQHGISLSTANVTIIGESHQARITGKYYGVTSSVVELKGANTTIRNLTIESLIGDNGVGPALSTGADNILFDNVQIIGWQDTYVGGGGTHLFHECIIVGSVDFICNGGESTVDYFLRCELQLQYRNNGGYISAPQGKVYFRDCRVTNAAANTNTMNNKFSLARPWRETGKAFFINTVFDIVPTYGFVTMSSNIFPLGSCGSVGNIKEADGSLLDFTNDGNTPKYIMTESDITTYGSIYDMCGNSSANLAEPVNIPLYKYTTLYVPDALVVPVGVTAYAIVSANNEYAELSELYTEGDVIPAFTPVILNAEVSDETTFRFIYADNARSAMSGTNLLSGSLTHQSLSETNTNYYTLEYNNDAVAFVKQGNNIQSKANVSYLALNEAIVNSAVLPLKDDSATSIIDSAIDKIKGDDVVYDLNGRRVSYPQKGQIYIVNGNKRIYMK